MIQKYIEEEEYDLELSEVSNSYSGDLSNFISEEGIVNGEKSKEHEVINGPGMANLNLTMEDIDLSLSYLDEVQLINIISNKKRLYILESFLC